MKPAHALLLALSTASLSGCRPETILGFAIGDIAGLWIASSYEFRSVSSSGTVVDIIVRDGASFTLSVNGTVTPPTVSTSFDDGSGNVVSGGGVVDIRQGTLTINTREYAIAQAGERLTLTATGVEFDFGTGPSAATLVIRLSRL